MSSSSLRDFRKRFEQRKRLVAEIEKKLQADENDNDEDEDETDDEIDEEEAESSSSTSDFHRKGIFFKLSIKNFALFRLFL